MSKFFKSDRDASATGASSPELDSEKKGVDSEGSVEERESSCGSKARAQPRACVPYRASDPHLALLLSSSSLADSVLSRAREAKREIGLISAIFLVFNRVLGTGIFAYVERCPILQY